MKNNLIKGTPWVWSDLHFGHKNIAGEACSVWKKGYRTFSSVEEMDDTLINQINNYVGRDDTLFLLGDFCIANHGYIPMYRERINCKNIHMLIGNHDRHLDRYAKYFSSINDVFHLNYNGRQIFMSHYGHRVWKNSHRGAIHLYGHSHGSLPCLGRSMDVGVDVSYLLFDEYRPFTLDEIIVLLEQKDPEFLDHHSEEKNLK